MDPDEEDDQEENQEEGQEEPEEEVQEEEVVEEDNPEEDDAGGEEDEGENDEEESNKKEPQKPTELADQIKKFSSGKKVTENVRPKKKQKMIEEDDAQQKHEQYMKALANVNLETGNKDDILNLLLTNNAEVSKPKVGEIPQNAKKIPRQYQNVESHYKNFQMKKESETEQKFNKTDNFHIVAEKNNPEFTNDFDTAVKKILSKMTKENLQPNEEILKILISDKEKLHSEIEQMEIVKPSYISQKVQNNLKKKQEKLQNIQAKINQDFMEKHTFTPVLQNVDPTSTKRNFEQFLHDQTNHTKKIKTKIQNIQEDDKKKQEELVSKMHPKIDEKSEKIFLNTVKINEPAYMRLFHKRYAAAKKELLKENQNQPEESKKEIGQNIELVKTKLIGKAAEKKKIGRRTESAKRMGSKEPKEKIEQSPIRPKASSADKKILKTPKKKEEEEKKPIIAEEAIVTNKMLLTLLIEKYKQVIGNVSPNPNSNQENSSGTTVIQEDVPQKEIQPQLNKLTLSQMNEAFIKMGYISKHENKESISKNTASNVNNKVTGDSMIQQIEQKLVGDTWEALKDTEDLISVDNLFLFLLCVHNLYAYYLYASFKDSHSKEEIAAMIPKKTSREQKINLILSKIAEEISKKINQTNKYICYDQNGVILIPLEKAKLIKRDFNLFYITFMDSVKSATIKTKQEEKKELNTSPFSPTINPESARLYSNFRKKVLDFEPDKPPKGKGHLDYIEKILMKRKRKELDNAKIKEEQSKKEVKDCTFRPQINKDRVPIVKEEKSERYKELFKKGTNKLLNRKNKAREDFDIEKYGKDCSFKPTLVGKDEKIPETKFHNDIYNEKGYELLYTRLKNGRMDRWLKEAVHDKFDFDNSLKEYFMKNKTKETTDISGSKEVVLHQATSHTDNAIPKVKDSETQKQMTNEIQQVLAEKIKNNQSSNSSTEPNADAMKGDMEKKDAIPLLIIDVNIRPGVKKKIYVFEGDTAEGLAEKFSTEHSLDAETKGKLQVLIQNHMLRLLTRIDEENQSISEKSSTYNLS